MRKSRRALTLAASAAVAAVLLAAGASSAQASSTTGSISGHLSTDGSPRVGAWVNLFDSQFGYVAGGNVDGAGAFHFDALAPGSYYLAFYTDLGTQYYHGVTESSRATAVAVTAGADVDVEESTLPTGSIEGILTDSAGAPVPFATVNAFPVEGIGGGVASTDSTGHYRLNAWPGVYTVDFRPQTIGGGVAEYAHQSLDTDTAAHVTVAVGQNTRLDEQLLPTGSVSGRYTDAAGAPIVGGRVQLVLASGFGGPSATTDDAGRYRLDSVFVGDYHAAFTSPDGSTTQYAPGVIDVAQAGDVSVAAGQETVVDDAALATGSVTVTATDASTGKKINKFCAGIDGQSSCATTGTATVTGVRVGAESAYVYTEDFHYFVLESAPVTVGTGTVALPVKLQPGATITLTVKDRATGRPVADACASAQPTGDGRLPDGYGYCSDSQGVLKIGPIIGGTFNFYVHGPGGSSYGDQWVGASGGTGVQGSALAFTIATGKTIAGPTVLLDHAGTISGTVTDPAGHPVVNGLVSNSPYEPGSGPTGVTARTDPAGHYTITTLGPYRWPLLVTAVNLPSQWSGGVPNHKNATLITVTAGATTTYSPTLVAGITLSGTVRTGAGAPDPGRVIVYNQGTGDVMGVAETDPAGNYSMSVLGSQLVKFRLEPGEASQPGGWFGGADLASATAITLQHKQNLVQDLVFG